MDKEIELTKMPPHSAGLRPGGVMESAEALKETNIPIKSEVDKIKTSDGIVDANGLGASVGQDGKAPDGAPVPKKNFFAGLCDRSGKISPAKQHTQLQDQNPDLRVKKAIRKFVEGKFVTIVMTLVTMYALVGVSYSFQLII